MSVAFGKIYHGGEAHYTSLGEGCRDVVTQRRL